MNARLFLVVVFASALGFLTITSPIWWTGIFAAGVWVAIVAAGSWLPMAIGGNLPADADAMWGEAKSAEMARWLALTMAGGIGAAIAIWTLSMYALGTIVPGVGVTLGMAAWGLVRAARHRPIIAARIRAIDWPFATATVITLALALGFTMYDVWWGDVVLVPPTLDVASHVYLAVLVRDFGLPLVNLVGEPGLHTPTHIGFAVWLHGISPVTEAMLQMSRASFVFGALTVFLTFFGLLGGLAKRPWVWVLASIIPNFWSVAPQFYQLIRRDGLTAILLPMQSDFFPDRISICNLTNLPEVLTFAVGAPSLIVFALWVRIRMLQADDPAAASRQRLRAFVVFAVLILVSVNIKPNLFVMFAPALFVFLTIAGWRRNEWLVTASMFIVGIFLYLLPQIFFSTPDLKSEWAINDMRTMGSRAVRVALMLWLVIGISVGISLGLRLIHWQRKLDVIDFLVICSAGATVFFCIFNSDASNEIWPLIAMVSLIAPFVVAWPAIEACRPVESTWELEPRKGWRAIVFGVFVGLVALHVYSSPFIATTAAKPFCESREQVSAIIEVGRELPPDATVAIDPSFFATQDNPYASGVPIYLFRRVLWLDFGSETNRQLKKQWIEMFRTKRVTSPDLFASRDAMIVRDEQTPWLTDYLQSHGWKRQVRRNGLELWVKASN